MNFSPKLIIYFFVGLACILLGWFIHRESNLTLLSKDISVSTFEARTDSVLAQAARQSTRLEVELLAGNHDFQSLLQHSRFPAFIFENGQLLFWSDNTTLSDFDDIHALREEQLVENKFGKFLVIKQAVDPDFLILVCVPLEYNYGITNRYLVSGLNPAIFDDLKGTVVSELSPDLPEIYSPRGNFLYSIRFEKEVQLAGQENKLAAFLFGVAILLAILILVEIRKLLEKRGQDAYGFLVFAVLAILLRFSLLYFNFPASVFSAGLFNPKYYAASFLSPSIGDLLINGLLILLISYEMLLLVRKKITPDFRFPVKAEYLPWIKMGLMAVFYFLVYFLYHFYSSIYTNSLIVLDITQSLQFDFYKIALLAAILVHSAAFMVLSYLLLHVYGLLPKFNFSYGLALFAFLGGLFTLANYLELEITFLVLAIILFTAVLIFWEHRAQVGAVPFRNNILVVVIISLSAWVGSMAIYHHYHQQRYNHKQQFAKSLGRQNDVVSEFLLDNVAREVSNDPLIRQKLIGPLPDIAFIQQKIVKYYLRNDFEKYETTVKIFDPAGNQLQAKDSAETLSKLRQFLQAKSEPASFKNLYLVSSDRGLSTRKYLQIIPVPVSEKATATVVLELTPKKLTPSSVIPELLIDQKFVQPLQSKGLSYAVFKNSKLLLSEGDYDYGFHFKPEWLESERIFVTGRTGLKRDHLAVNQDNGNILVISTNRYLLRDIWSNFSFLFLLHLAVFLLAIGLYSFSHREFLSRFRSNFSTKIQLFLNFGIMLPLLLISISIGGQVTASYKNDLTDTYEKRGKLIQENLNSIFNNGTDFSDKSKLDELLTDYSNLSETDINFYDKTGKLQASSQPLIFEAGLLSKLINPQAYIALVEEGQKDVLLAEKAGSLQFSSLYLPLFASGKDDLLGFIALPFFDSEKELNRKLIELTTTILNIFTIMFIGFMALTVLAARVLTVPLNLITQKLKETTLTGQNERIQYAANDEIGLLVKEYNQMISKLEESKNELAVKEKEAAWREMARQVAHEIKNPLTPMKLSLQYLQKAIAEKRDNVEELISKISQTLITNIDILSDIATSFSSFTSLPELKNEPIDLGAVLKRSVDLNFDPATARFEFEPPMEALTVIADENLMTRTFNNLFLNALQAIPTGREPFIQVGLHRVPGNKALISIKDNGTGIPAEVRDKVFIPNFSTKYSGSGIGLAVAKKGIEGAGGQIWFETVENEGTTFFIELPLA